MATPYYQGFECALGTIYYRYYLLDLLYSYR
jgi:hypothetical protein